MKTHVWLLARHGKEVLFRIEAIDAVEPTTDDDFCVVLLRSGQTYAINDTAEGVFHKMHGSRSITDA